jgi:hypothetical protein
LAVVLSLWPAAAPAAPGDPPAAFPDSLAEEEIPADLVDVVRELDALDQPLPRRDVLLGAAHPRYGRGWGAGSLRWRTGAVTGGLRHDGRFEVTGTRLTGRGVVRLRPEAAPEVVGGGHLRLGAWSAWAGHLALRHGFGLLAVDQGRRGSLAADQGLGGVSGGLAVRTAAQSGARGFQAGIETTAGRWRLASMWQTAAGGPGAVSTRLALDAGSGDWAVLVQSDTAGIASSWSGRLARQATAVQWELAGRQDGPGAANLAAVAGLSWLAGPGLRLELLSGVAGGPWPVPVAVLPSGARSGWACRLGWRDRGQGALEVLLQGARLWPELSPTRRRTQQVVEMAWERRAGPGLTATLRARRTARSESTWSERNPWQPAEASPAATRTTLTAALEWERNDTRLTAQWRSFAVGAGSGGGTRQLMSFGARRGLGRRWGAWVDAATAWGEPVDLVRGLAPLPGLVVARHWGRWHSEVMAGATGDLGALSVRLALARRLPEPGTADDPEPGLPSLEGWVEVSGSW